MTVWGDELSNAKPGIRGNYDGFLITAIEAPISIESTSYLVTNSFALDTRGLSELIYKFNNADVVTDGVFQILGTEKQYDNISDLVIADFTETVVAENINFGATIEALVNLKTPIANALLTGVLVQFKKVVNNWDLDGHLRVK